MGRSTQSSSEEVFPAKAAEARNEAVASVMLAGSLELLSVIGHLDSRERIVKPTLIRSVSFL